MLLLEPDISKSAKFTLLEWGANCGHGYCQIHFYVFGVLLPLDPDTIHASFPLNLLPPDVLTGYG